MKYNETILNKEVVLQRRSKGDKIATFKAKELGLVQAPVGTCYRLSLLSGVKIEVYSNRTDGSSLSVSLKNLPRFVRVPRTGRASKVRIMAIQRLY